MIELKHIEDDNVSGDAVVNFIGTPHDLIIEFIMLQKVISENPKLKALWEIAKMMRDDIDVDSSCLKERYGSDEELKS